MRKGEMNATAANVDPSEIAKFEASASRWWDKSSEFRPLHEINPLRLEFISRHVDLSGARILDVGCGGGILSESMALAGATVTGIDLGKSALKVARLHALETGVEIEYLQQAAEDLATERSGAYDVITCMEMLEHVPDPASIVEACARLVRPGGRIIFSTISRSPKAYLQAIIGAEYVLGLLPRGTHDYNHFIRPSELCAWSRRQDLRVISLEGMTYNPLSRQYRLTGDISVNYLACMERPDQGGRQDG